MLKQIFLVIFLPHRSVKNWDEEAVNLQTNLFVSFLDAFKGQEAVDVNILKLEKK